MSKETSTSLAELHSLAPVILPSLLLCDFGRLNDEIQRLEDAGVKALHLDVMDGQFVPNLSYGFPIVEAVRQATSLFLDVHLMIATPERYVEQFVQAGADLVTFHVEATQEPEAIIEKVRDQQACVGLAFNPHTPIDAVLPHADQCDLLLAMSVEPGFGGQEFNADVPGKIEALREKCTGKAVIEVDGGINPQTIGKTARAGADFFVAGSAIFRADDYGAAVEELHRLASVIDNQQ